MKKEFCIKCGEIIDSFDDPLLCGHCGKCTKVAGLMVECIFCEYLELENSPPCLFDIIPLNSQGKCKWWEPRISSSDLVFLVRKYQNYFNPIN